MQYLCRNHRKLHTVQGTLVLEEQHIRFIWLGRKHPDVHVPGKKSRAHKRNRRLLVRSQIRLIHTIDLEERRPEAMGLADVLG